MESLENVFGVIALTFSCWAALDPQTLSPAFFRPDGVLSPLCFLALFAFCPAALGYGLIMSTDDRKYRKPAAALGVISGALAARTVYSVTGWTGHIALAVVVLLACEQIYLNLRPRDIRAQAAPKKNILNRDIGPMVEYLFWKIVGTALMLFSCGVGYLFYTDPHSHESSIPVIFIMYFIWVFIPMAFGFPLVFVGDSPGEISRMDKALFKKLIGLAALFLSCFFPLWYHSMGNPAAGVPTLLTGLAGLTFFPATVGYLLILDSETQDNAKTARGWLSRAGILLSLVSGGLSLYILYVLYYATGRTAHIFMLARLLSDGTVACYRAVRGDRSSKPLRTVGSLGLAFGAILQVMRDIFLGLALGEMIDYSLEKIASAGFSGAGGSSGGGGASGSW